MHLKLTARLLITGVLITNSVTAQKAKNLDSLFTTLYNRGLFNGSVLVAEKGKPIYQKTLGYANLDTKQPLTDQTMFELASVSKQFTSMAIMQLHAAGKLNYTDSIRKYFPQLPYQGVTINNLLHHTSGIPEFLGWGEQYVDIKRVNYNADILNALAKYDLKANFKPNDSFSYSNTNYVLLALIVEKVSGMSFSDYLDKNIFKPLNMAHTKVYGQRHGKKIADYALGYIYDVKKGKFTLNDSLADARFERYMDGIAGPYGISSTTQDMLKWDQALYTDKLISLQEQQAAYVPSKLNNGKIAEIIGLPYGFGWLIAEGGKDYMHSGGYPGYMAMMDRVIDGNKTIIFLTNKYNVINLYQLTATVQDILDNEKFEIPKAIEYKKSVTLSPAMLKSFEGVYPIKADPKYKLTITIEMDHVYAQFTGQLKAEIFPESETMFFYTAVAAKIRFIKNDAGVITGLVLMQGGQELETTKQ